MADKKITALAASGALAPTDLVAVVVDPAGTPVTKKATLADVLALGGGGGGGGGLVLLEQHTAIASAALDFVAAITATYDDYQIEFVGLEPTIPGSELRLQVSVDGGATWQTTNYRYTIQYFNAANANGSLNSVTGTYFPVGTGLGRLDGTLRLYDPLGAGHKAFVGTLSVFQPTPSHYQFQSAGWYASASGVNALRFICDSGTIASGTIRIYGLQK